MKRSWLYIAFLAFSPLTLAGVATVITQTPEGEILSVEKVPTPPKPAFMSFAEADANHDGRVDNQEARDAGIMNLGEVDKNHDGFLNQEEYEAAATAVDVPTSGE